MAKVSLLARLMTAGIVSVGSMSGCVGFNRHVRGIDEKPVALGYTHTEVASNQFMHYILRGEENKETIMLFHGFGGSVYEWKDVMPILAENYKVYAVDLPGFGDSDKVERQKKAEDLMPSVISFMDKNNIRKTNAVFHSLSGDLGRGLKRKYSDRFNKIFLEAGYIPGYTYLAEGISGHVVRWPVVGDLVGFCTQLIVDENRCLKIMRKYSFDNGKITQAHAREAHRNLLSQEDWKAFLDMGKNYKPWRNKNEDEGFVVIQGTKDKLMKRKNGLIPNCPVYEVEAGHWIHNEKPETLAEIIKLELKKEEK